MTLAISITPETISIYADGDFFQVEKSHPNFQPLLRELRKQPRDEAAVMELVDVPRFMATVTAGRVAISPDGVLFKGEPVGGYMVERLMAMAESGDEVETWALFMDNLMDNPDAEVREDLYKWMEAAKMPITPDGCIIAFKKVKADYTDVHTGKFNNSVGSVLEMERSLCDPSRHNTCSTGFHFCSAGYLSHFGGEKVMVVKINPRDVTAIPKDYQNHKARCCQYTVTGELKDQAAARHQVWTTKNVVNLENPQELPEVMLKRKAKSLKEVAPDPARTSGPPPVDDLSDDTPVKVQKKSAPKKSSAKKTPAKKPTAKKAPKKSPVGDTTVQVTKQAVDNAVQAGEATLTFVAKGVSFTKDQVADAMTAANHKVTAAARALGVPKSTLYGWVKKVFP